MPGASPDHRGGGRGRTTRDFLFGLRAAPFASEILAPALRVTKPVTLPILWPAMFLPQAMPARFADEFPFRLAVSDAA